MKPCQRRGMSSASAIGMAVVIVIALASVGYFSMVPGGEISALQSQVSSVQSQNAQLQHVLSTLQGNSSAFSNIEQNITALRREVGALPVMNQTVTVRTIRETWYLSPQAHQDRFDPSFIVVNQGDTLRLTLIDNDTVAHDFVVGPPYDVVVNATVPGLVNDLTGKTFTTAATNNSPGVVVTGSPGNVSVRYSFVAKYTGIYEFVCTYHALVGMIGYLVVLPNLSFETPQQPGHPAGGAMGANITIVQGAGSDVSGHGYSPSVATVIVGVNNTVTWTNGDNAPHTVSANDGTFESGNIATGSSFTYTFTRPGTYSYHCVYHPWMTGTIIVKGSS